MSLVLGLGVAGVALLTLSELSRELRADPRRPVPRAPQQRCPFCKGDLGAPGTRKRCSRCGTQHHHGCFEEHGGCSVYGCARQVTQRREARVLGPVQEGASDTTTTVDGVPEAGPTETQCTPRAEAPAGTSPSPSEDLDPEG